MTDSKTPSSPARVSPSPTSQPRLSTAELQQLRAQKQAQMRQRLKDLEYKIPENAKRRREVDELYEVFKREVDRDSVLTVSELNEFAPLFSEEWRQKCARKEYTSDEEVFLKDLSDRFQKRVNTRRPIHIVDDITGEEVCPPLPPIFANLSNLSSKVKDVVDRFSTALQLDDGLGVGPAALQKARATIDVVRCFSNAQAGTDIRRQAEEFTKMAAAVDNSGITTGIGHVKGTVPRAQQATTKPNVDVDPTDDIGFEPDI